MLLFFNFFNSRHPNMRFTMEKEMDQKIPFLDVLINNDTHFHVTSVYRKNTFTCLLTNYFSFTLHSYKLGLICTLVDKTYKINNTKFTSIGVRAPSELEEGGGGGVGGHIAPKKLHNARKHVLYKRTQIAVKTKTFLRLMNVLSFQNYS